MSGTSATSIVRLLARLQTRKPAWVRAAWVRAAWGVFSRIYCTQRTSKRRSRCLLRARVRYGLDSPCHRRLSEPRLANMAKKKITLPLWAGVVSESPHAEKLGSLGNPAAMANEASLPYNFTVLLPYLHCDYRSLPVF
eukprot:8369216-Pyramimonas_sp.AAC.1